jgi:hypothetical protein
MFITLLNKIQSKTMYHKWAGWLSRYSDWLRAEQPGDRIPVRTKFSAPVQTGPGAHPASYTIGTGSFPGVESGLGVTLTPHPLLVPWSKKQSTAIPVLSLRAFVACKKGEIYNVSCQEYRKSAVTTARCDVMLYPSTAIFVQKSLLLKS